MFSTVYVFSLLALVSCQSGIIFTPPEYGLWKLTHGLESFHPDTARQLWLHVCTQEYGESRRADFGPYNGYTALFCHGPDHNGYEEDKTSHTIDVLNGALDPATHKWEAVQVQF
ncbi:hypothetical protein IE81DRAFT_349079 [Ceraceosorus guamensis]|uniref:Uncharacterized protein n=1 Tax=Ceraceosorus guamensis TaxID=1522189 RepID=A0A316VSI5_9BASI|nr:hypothetical protein IE81DRAFT_349079 [Ceraceosorus guamensis]PWN40599.1 hypothetical protein IE81DRAFT_349079 [Ceraceosorus guamensis]